MVIELGAPDTRAHTFKSISRNMLADRQKRTGAEHETQRVSPEAPKGGQGPTVPLRLSAILEGSWDRVDGYVSFPRTYDDIGRLEVLLRGFATVQGMELDEYVVPEWDRNVFYINPDQSDPAEVPRLVAAVERESAYQPTPGDDYEIFRNDADVINACTGDSFCTIQVVQYAELREDGRDYSNYPDGAAQVVVYLVVTYGGDLVSAAVDIYDENQEFERTDFLYVGDELEFYAQAFNIDEPDTIYLIDYMSPRTLTENFILERTYYRPGHDYQDPDLPAEFDADVQPIQFLLEGARDDDASKGVIYAYAGPYGLGFDWEGLPGFVFQSSFEPPAPDFAPTQKQLGKPKTIR